MPSQTDKLWTALAIPLWPAFRDLFGHAPPLRVPSRVMSVARRSVPPPPGEVVVRRSRARLVRPRFQLKYTALLCGTVAFVMLALGAGILSEADQAAHIAELSAEAAEHANEAAEDAEHQSQSNAMLLRQNAAMSGMETPELAASIKEANAEEDRKAKERILAIRARAGDIKARKAEAEKQRSRMRIVLSGGGISLLALLFVISILVTQKVVGPIEKMKRLLRRVGTGRLLVKERLRKGDELEDLYDTFLQMTYSLRAMQYGQMATVDAALEKAVTTGGSAEVIEMLRGLRAQMSIGFGRLDASARRKTFVSRDEIAQRGPPSTGGGPPSRGIPS